MDLLLRLHMAQDVALVPPAEHRELAGIDPRGAIFPGMIHPDHAGHTLLGRRVARQAVTIAAHRRILLGRARYLASKPANARAYSRFIAAMDSGSPGIRYVGSSHGFDGSVGRCDRRSASVVPTRGGAAHSGNGLGQKPCSTPTWITASPAATSTARRTR